MRVRGVARLPVSADSLLPSPRGGKPSTGRAGGIGLGVAARKSPSRVRHKRTMRAPALRPRQN